MQKYLYSVLDRKAHVFAAPFTSTNDQTATRLFVRACNDPANDLGMFPIDYALFQVGMFDDEDGIIKPTEIPRLLIDGRSVIDGKPELSLQPFPADQTLTERN